MFQLPAINSVNLATGEMQQYSELLLREKARLHSELGSRLESLHSGRGAVQDQAPVVHEQFVAIWLNNVAHGKIKAIDAALERLKRREYGICEECGEPISAKRLKALPWTRYCIHCAREPR
jgi:DnaK suppressor protein